MRRFFSAFTGVSVAAALAIVLSACAPSANGAAPSSQSGSTLTVFAAASLKSTFTELAKKFEAAHPGTTVKLSFAGSSDLVTQISAGAPADVFASADTRNMDKLRDADLTEGTPANFARNVLTIAVAQGNPASIDSFSDLASPGTRVVVCAPQVPCGAAAAKVQEAEGVSLTPVSEESSVTDVLGKVLSGQADAGLVYATDVKASGGKVTALPIAKADSAINTYPISAVKGSRNGALAAEFVSLVMGDDGQSVLAAAGFGKP